MAQEGASGSGEGQQVDGDGEPLFTVSEYLEELEEQEKEAEMVLGGDVGDKCSYDEGYRPRQGVFVCQTCTPNTEAGVCLGCSLVCHDKHEIVEIWTRRRFRCDCGNSKFGGMQCKLKPDKDAVNSKNVYNQNYRGVYCTCHRPYPDPERAERDEEERMIQCTICEDWFHEEHLGIPMDQIPHEDDSTLEDFICGACVAARVNFIEDYPELRLFPLPVTKAGVGSGEVENGDPAIEVEPQREYCATESSRAETNGCSQAHSQKREMDVDMEGEGVDCKRTQQRDACGNGSNVGMVGMIGERNGQKQPLEGSKEEREEDGQRGGLYWLGTGCKRKQRNCHNLVGICDEVVGRLEQNLSGICVGGVTTTNGLLSDANVTPSTVSEGSAELNGGIGGAGCEGCTDGGGMNGRIPQSRATAHVNGAVVEADCEGGADSKGTNGSLQSATDSNRQGNGVVTKSRALFLKKGWRLELCLCEQCRTMYDEIRVDFLLDPEDTMQRYQEKGKAKTEQRQMEIERVQNNLWSSLGRTGQVEFLHGFNDLAENLRSFLMPFGQSGQPVTEQDVRGFFEQLKEKRRRLT